MTTTTKTTHLDNLANLQSDLDSGLATQDAVEQARALGLDASAYDAVYPR